ncbi:MAG: SpoIID/LytB domain-containing protein [Odoribacteraceae bacterium]|jgi:SpoIID/LytB domain protein|nr:SpoIID/LytB domain-containing protein [Odoribacteraceae bacterium]
MHENTLSVGILTAREIHFRLNGAFRGPDGRRYRGAYAISGEDDCLLLRQGAGTERLAPGFTLVPEDPVTATFDLAGVTIGIRFHWQRAEEQRFRGTLAFTREGALLAAVNIITLEEYLTSVISSEMRATSPPEFLKAHAVISRSWLLAQQEKRAAGPRDTPACAAGSDALNADGEREICRWYDREEHDHYDVCADDHCQRYQGTARAGTPAVEEAVRATRGQVLVHDGQVCDARFSKCCGGASERFDLTWEPRFHPYLVKVDDNDGGHASPDLRVEEHARAWILSSPPADCNTGGEILAEILNDYDRETRDFFRWTVAYTAAGLSALVESRLHAALGDLLDLQPLERGVSGRITRLRLVGTGGTLVIGKELLIRSALSPSHLYSSAFVPVIERDSAGRPSRFILHGAGWGHGVGLCQIGAAGMGARGYTYRQILARYFPGTNLETRY